MRAITIGRNYAETLFELARQEGGGEGAVARWSELMDAAAAAFGTPSIESVLVSPRVTTQQKIEIVRQALAGAPSRFVLFIEIVIKRHRQQLFGLIADEFRTMADVELGRVRAGITLARDADPLTRQVIAERLARALGKEVIAGWAVDPTILGGTVVRIGDQIYDGSVRKRLSRLRRQLLTPTA